jgi:hypothetical protein
VTPVLTPCLVCGRRRHWWGTGFWWYDLGRIQPFPAGSGFHTQPVLLAAPVCSRECAQRFKRVLGGRVELSHFERQRRGWTPVAVAEGEART